MRMRLAMGVFLSVALIGLSGCPSEKTIRPGVWSFVTFDDNDIAGDPAGIRLYEDGSVGFHPLNGVFVAHATGWFQLGDTFTLELENPGGEIWERMWLTAKIESSFSLFGELRNADTGEVYGPFGAQWIER